MVQPVKDKFKKYDNKKHPQIKDKKPHPKFGTSKLEKYFEEEFLKKIGVDYIWQYEAKDIGRFFDFAVPSAHILIEVDGDYYHSYGLTYEEKNPMQKHNQWVDKTKDEWALANGIPVLRFWEHDIRENPEKIMKELKEAIIKYTDKQNKIKDKNRRH